MAKVRLKPKDGKRPLMRHQQAGVEWIAKHGIQHPALFLEMRLGKTLLAVRQVQGWYPSPRETCPCLVAAPTEVLQAWEKELKLEGEPYIMLQGLPLMKRANGIAYMFESPFRVWGLLNYETLRATPAMADLPFKVVVLDESTVIKNPKAIISRICTERFRQVEHRMILSGLPSPESDLDLFQQFKFLHGSFMGCSSYWRFRATYFEAGSIWDPWEPLPGVRKQIKDVVHAKSFVMRRQDAGIKGKKISETRSIPMAKEQRKAYDQVEKDFSVWVDSEEEGFEQLMETEHAIVQQMWLARMAGGFDVAAQFKWKPKMDSLVSLLRGELSNQPVVVWFRFNAEIEHARRELERHYIFARALTGDMPREQRKANNEWFQTSKQKQRVLLCQIKLAKYGVDFSAADTAIYYSMTYSCEEIAQSKERIFHPMKTSPLLYLYLTSADSIDEDILYAANQKVTTSKLFMMKVKESMLRRLGGNR